MAAFIIKDDRNGAQRKDPVPCSGDELPSDPNDLRRLCRNLKGAVEALERELRETQRELEVLRLQVFTDTSVLPPSEALGRSDSDRNSNFSPIASNNR